MIAGEFIATYDFQSVGLNKWLFFVLLLSVGHLHLTSRRIKKPAGGPKAAGGL
jgi:hypothetical protein